MKYYVYYIYLSMVGLAAGVSNGGERNINNLGLQYREQCWWGETDSIEVLQEKFQTIHGSTVFLKIDTEGHKTSRSCVEDGLVIAVTCMYALLVRLGVGGWGAFVFLTCTFVCDPNLSYKNEVVKLSILRQTYGKLVLPLV